jgi:hypothetical protein
VSNENSSEQAGRVVCNALIAKAREQGNVMPEGWEEALWEDPSTREQCIFAAGALAQWILSQPFASLEGKLRFDEENKADDVAGLETVKMVSVGGGEKHG